MVNGQPVPSNSEVAAVVRGQQSGEQTQPGRRGREAAWSAKSLPEQRPNAAGAKVESQETLEVTAEK